MLPDGGDTELEAAVTAVTGELTAMDVEVGCAKNSHYHDGCRA